MLFSCSTKLDIITIAISGKKSQQNFHVINHFKAALYHLTVELSISIASLVTALITKVDPVNTN
jgi:hypothetical protein